MFFPATEFIASQCGPSKPRWLCAFKALSAALLVLGLASCGGGSGMLKPASMDITLLASMIFTAIWSRRV